MKKLGAALILILLVSGFIAYQVVKPYYEFMTKTLQISPLRAIFQNDVKRIDDTVNILVLGIAGGNHDGPNLSDSIVVLHYDFKTDHLSTIGIPRDIWSDTLKDKINSAYAYGEAKQEDGGLKLAKAEVGAIIGQPIQYSLVISFAKFRDLIDYLGGVDVNVEHSFTDPEFPIEGKENDLCNGDTTYKCRYETISFKKGMTHMDGTTALKFARSRHAEGNEGSDFARSRRQQQIISAIKNKVVNIVKAYDLPKVKGLYEKSDSLVNRDVTNQQLMNIALDVVFSKRYVQKNMYLPEELFKVPNYADYDGKYVLVPAKNWDTVHAFVRCLLAKEDDKPCTYLIDQGKENK